VAAQSEGSGNGESGTLAAGPADSADQEGGAPADDDGAALDLLADGPAVALADLRQALGTDESVVSLVVYDTYLVTQFRDADEPVNVDRMVWREGVLTGPDPAGFSADYEGQFFALDAVDPAVLADLSRQALDEFELAGAEVTHIIVDRGDRLDNGAVSVRVYVRHPQRGGGGYVLADLEGTIVRVVG
jgi:hypothetical protein